MGDRILTDTGPQTPNVLLEWFSQPEKDEDASKEAGHAVFKDVDIARWYKKGSNGQATECRVERMPKWHPVIWQHYQASYKAWKAGQAEPLDGTPLSEMPWITRAEVETLRAVHIRTVEDLAATTDADFGRIGMGARALRDKARAWQQTAVERGKMTELLASRDVKIEALSGEVAGLRADLEQAIATINDLRPRTAAPSRKAG